MAEPPLELPSWVACTPDEVHECAQVSVRRMERGFGSHRDLGVVATMAWLLVGEVAPMTGRVADLSREAARAESWVALCVAAGQPEPRLEDWRRLGTEPMPSRETNREVAYGVWRTLAWLMGVREDWPVYTSWHRAASMRKPYPHLDVPVDQRDCPGWRAANAAAWERDEADAVRHWLHVRELADATADQA